MKNEIQYVTLGDKHTITFMNGKVWDIAANNPYNKLNFPIKKRLNGGQALGYIINHMIAPKKLSNELGIIDTFFISSRYLRSNDLKVVYAQSSHGVSLFNKKCAAVKYSILALNADNEIIGARGCIYVFDSLGRVVQKFMNLDVAPFEHSLVLTEDGKYLGISFGGPDNEHGDGLTKPTVQIYKVKSGKKIFEKSIPSMNGMDEIGVGGPIGISSFQFTSSLHTYDPLLKKAGRDSEYYIFKNGFLFYKKINNDYNLLIKSISDTTFTYKLNNQMDKEFKVDLFERDFQNISNQLNLN